MLLVQYKAKIFFKCRLQTLSKHFSYRDKYILILWKQFQHKDVPWLSVFTAFFGNFQFNCIYLTWISSVKKLSVLFPFNNTSNSNTHEILHISLPDPLLEIGNDRWDLWEKRILSEHIAQGHEKMSTFSK